MRIVAGVLGGRLFDSPPGHKTHPMSEKARGAVFNMLGDISGLTFLDAFAGSGALGFEAISRGAASAVAIDVDKDAHQTIIQNSRQLGLQNQIKAIRANASGWSHNNPDVLFDVVLLDPPYDNVKANVLEGLAYHAKPGGLVVASLPPKLDFHLPLAHFDLLASKNYGDASVVYWRRLT